MSLWLKILIGAWLYFSVGFGVALFGQLVSKAFQDMDEYMSIGYDLKLDPDDYEFGGSLFAYIVGWPIVLLTILAAIAGVQFKKIFRKLWSKLDEKEDE